MAVHWKPSSVDIPVADYREMSRWYESKRYAQIAKAKKKAAK